jgi:hypothetical protein
MWGEVAEQGHAGSPGSGGASPYLRRRFRQTAGPFRPMTGVLALRAMRPLERCPPYRRYASPPGRRRLSIRIWMLTSSTQRGKTRMIQPI